MSSENQKIENGASRNGMVEGDHDPLIEDAIGANGKVVKTEIPSPVVVPLKCAATVLNGNGTTEKCSNNRRQALTTVEKMTLFTLCFINLINYMDRFTLAGVLNDVRDHFVISDKQVGLIQTVYTLLYMATAPLFGYLGDRYSRRWNITIFVSLWSLATLLGSFVGTSFELFVLTRALVGVGQASFSTIAPTIIGDVVSAKLRSTLIALFYFLLPIGSGLGYIVGAEAAVRGDDWRWCLRVTPFLGLIAVLLLIFATKDPQRGGCERGTASLTSSTSYVKDISYLLKNKTFMLSTLGYTCMAFVSSALSWWAPTFLTDGFKLQPDAGDVTMAKVSFQFGLAMMFSGLIGVPVGAISSQVLKAKSLKADPLICAVAMLLSAPLLYTASVTCTSHTFATLVLVFLGMLCLNLCWCIVADIILYTVVPTRRSAAQGLQILISFAFGAAGSPYLVGLVSDCLKEGSPIDDHEHSLASIRLNYESLNTSLYMAYAVEILGGIFFLLTAFFIVNDKQKCDNAIEQGGEISKLPKKEEGNLKC